MFVIFIFIFVPIAIILFPHIYLFIYKRLSKNAILFDKFVTLASTKFGFLLDGMLFCRVILTKKTLLIVSGLSFYKIEVHSIKSLKLSPASLTVDDGTSSYVINSSSVHDMEELHLLLTRLSEEIENENIVPQALADEIMRDIIGDTDKPRTLQETKGRPK